MIWSHLGGAKFCEVKGPDVSEASRFNFSWVDNGVVEDFHYTVHTLWNDTPAVVCHFPTLDF